MSDAMPLSGWRVAVPESRQLDVLSNMLVERGADTLRCPLVSIHDSPRKAIVQQWLTEFCQENYDDLIILTGEGIRRLTSLAEESGLQAPWREALGRVRKIARGPKPGNALRALKLKPDVLAQAPTTEGVIATLQDEDLHERLIGVQLYGEEPNHLLQSFLRSKGATVSTVAPYVYASDVETEAVETLIHEVLSHTIDIVVFTSIIQVKRLLSVASKMGKASEFHQALGNTHLAAVGPVVAKLLEEKGLAVAMMPDEKFFMKPLIRKMVEFVAQQPPR